MWQKAYLHLLFSMISYGRIIRTKLRSLLSEFSLPRCYLHFKF